MPKGFFWRAQESSLRANSGLCVNRTLIDRETNNMIRMKSPAVYLKQIEDEIGPSALKDLLESHLLPSGIESPLKKGDFESFIKVRQELIWTQNQASNSVR